MAKKDRHVRAGILFSPAYNAPMTLPMWLSAHRFRQAHSKLIVGLLTLLAGCSPLILTLDDAMVESGKEARLHAYAEREPILGLRSDVKGICIEFRANGTVLGRAKTNSDGCATIKCKCPPGLTRIEARVIKNSESPAAEAHVFEMSHERVMIAVDIDKTLSRTEYKQLILKPEDEESDPIKGSRETMRQLSKEFHIIYVTARPRFLLEKTREWLAEHEYPDGPVVVAPSVRVAIYAFEFKRKTLKALRDDWPALLIGIGDRASDADAYGANDMLTLIVARRRDEDYGPHAIVLRDWKTLREFFEQNRDDLRDPRRAKEAVKGERMLQQPIYPWMPHED